MDTNIKQKLFVCVGLPSSGKTTWAKQYCTENPNTIRVSRDDIREMLTPIFKHGGSMEHLVTDIELFTIEKSLIEGYNVIVDATNFRGTSHFQRIIDRIGTSGIDLEIKSFLDVPVGECIVRDSKREKSVGVSVITRMYNKYLSNG